MKRKRGFDIIAIHVEVGKGLIRFGGLKRRCTRRPNCGPLNVGKGLIRFGGLKLPPPPQWLGGQKVGKGLIRFGGLKPESIARPVLRAYRWKGANSLRRLETVLTDSTSIPDYTIGWKGANSLRRLETGIPTVVLRPSDNSSWKGANSLRRLETLGTSLETLYSTLVGKGLIRFGGLKLRHRRNDPTVFSTCWKGANSLRRLETSP